MSRKWFYLFMLVMLVLSTSGIAGAQESIEDVDPTGATIVWWHNHSQHREEWIQEKIAQFNAENEWGITVEALYQGSYDDIRDKMNAAIQSGDTPALVVSYQNDQAFYQQANALVNIDDYINSAKWGLTEEEIADYYPVFWKQDVHPAYDNQRLGFPPNRSMTVLYYNMDWLEKLGYDGPPTDWNTFSEMACAATDADAGTGGYAFYDSASNLAGMVFSRGGDIGTEDGLGYNLNAPEMIAALQWLQDLVNDGCAYTPSERYGDQADFANQRVLFTMGSSSGIPFYESAVNEGEKGAFNWGVAAFPTGEGVDPVVNVYGGSITIPKTTPEQQLAAWLFLKWFTGPALQAEWVEISGYFPTRASTVDEPVFQAYMEANPHYAQAYEILGIVNHMYEPQLISYTEVRDLMDQASARVVQGENVEEVVTWLQEAADEAVAEFE